MNKSLVDAVARCLAKHDGKHIGASEWAGQVGDAYRVKVGYVLKTIENWHNGKRSGGLP